MMRKIAFILAIIGLSILVALLLKEPLEVETIEGLVVGEVVSIKGIAEEEKKLGSGKIIIINEIPIYCECSENYIGLNVRVYGSVERFPENLRIRAFKITRLSQQNKI